MSPLVLISSFCLGGIYGVWRSSFLSSISCVREVNLLLFPTVCWRGISVGIPGEVEPAQARGPTSADTSKSLMSSWTSRRSSKRSLKEPEDGPGTWGITDPGSPGARRSMRAEPHGKAPPGREEMCAAEELGPCEQSHQNVPNSERLSHRFGSYLEVAKRALNRGRNHNFSLCWANCK